MDSKGASDVGRHGIVGNLRTAALVDDEGTVDWLCHPRFDSPSIFASILDSEKGGWFKVRPTTGFRSRQTYIPETNVLQTRFWSEQGVACLTDFMPIEPARQDRGHHRFVRRIEVTHGELEILVEFMPRPDFGRIEPRLVAKGAAIVVEGGSTAVVLRSDRELRVDGAKAALRIRLRQGESATFVMDTLHGPGQSDPHGPDEGSYNALLTETIAYWRNWLRACTYRGRWREHVQRSALVLKLLTYAPTGAMVAAPTTSLPTDIGGERNWDYRYTWFRDASFVVYALVRIGFRDEANAFMDWMRTVLKQGPALRPMYSITGDQLDGEEELSHLRGHRDSRPVRVGNLATDQLQLDFYGAMVDAVYLFNKYGMPVDEDLWNDVRRVIEWVSENWSRPDQSIWEPRTPAKQYTFSKVMCWVALDRALRLAGARSLPAPVDRWRQVRDEIAHWVGSRGWDEKLQAFTQSEGSPVIDAANLLVPLVFFASPRDRRVKGTIDAVRAELSHDALVLRYLEQQSDDGLGGRDGAFGACCFWMVEALTRQGRLREARRDFETLLSLANPLGLYAEQFTLDGQLLGNFPQALTHLAFISAAFNLDRALNDRKEVAPNRSSTAWRAYTEPQFGGPA